MIFELVLYETERIKMSVQTSIQLVGKHVYICGPYRKKIPVEGERHPINLKKRRGLFDLHFVFSNKHRKK
jgi:hypothetical protein